MSKLDKHTWESWEGEVITQMYTEIGNGNTVIVLENGRGATFRTAGAHFFSVKDPYADVRVGHDPKCSCGHPMFDHCGTNGGACIDKACMCQAFTYPVTK